MQMKGVKCVNSVKEPVEMWQHSSGPEQPYLRREVYYTHTGLLTFGS